MKVKVPSQRLYFVILLFTGCRLKGIFFLFFSFSNFDHCLLWVKPLHICLIKSCSKSLSLECRYNKLKFGIIISFIVLFMVYITIIFMGITLFCGKQRKTTHLFIVPCLQQNLPKEIHPGVREDYT